VLTTLGRLRQIILEASARPPSGFIGALQSNVVDHLRADPDFVDAKIDRPSWRRDHAAIRVFPAGAFEGVVYMIYPPNTNGVCIVDVLSAYDELRSDTRLRAPMMGLLRVIRQHFINHMVEYGV